MPTRTKVIQKSPVFNRNKLKNKTTLPPINKKTVATTHYFLVLDESGSMINIRQDVIDAVNNRISHIKSLAKDNQNITFSMISFDSSNNWHNTNEMRVNQHFTRQDVNSINANFSNFQPNGGTPLLKATLHAIRQIRDNVTIGPEDAVLLEIITDGEENTSKILPQTFLDELNRCNKDGYWTLTFQVPFGGFKSRLIRDFNIPDSNIIEWETTSKGTQQVTQSHNMAFSNYMGERFKGTRALTSYYAALDLGDLSTREVKNNLDDVSANYQEFKVVKEEEIKQFVEKHTGKPYVAGSTFYLLTKPETLQEYKEILVREKGKKSIYGGEEARKLLGLPTTGNVKVDPYNTSIFEVYCSSNSTNRKLVRGTTVLVNKY